MQTYLEENSENKDMNKITLLFNLPVVILDKYTSEFIDSGYHVGLPYT